MEIRQLRYFIAIAEREHFNRAAEYLHIVQPALTRQMKLLEEELGVQLFERLPRGVRLTPAGRFFLEEARAILRRISNAVSGTQAAAVGHAGRLRLGVIEMAAWHGLVPESIRLFRRRFPAVELMLSVLSSSDQIDALLAKRLDAGLLYHPPQNIGLSTLALMRHPVMIAVPAESPLAKLDRVGLGDLEPLSFVGFRREASPQFHDKIQAECRARNFSPHFVTETGGEAEMLALVSAGVGVCFVNACQRWRVPHAVRILPLVDFHVDLELHYAWPEQAAELPVAHFGGVLRSVLAQEGGLATPG